MSNESTAKSLEDVLPAGSKDFIRISADVLNHGNLPEEMKLGFVNTDIWRIDALNAPTLDCTVHPDGYCLQSASIFYVGPTLIACQPPFAYIQWKKKSACI